MSVWSLAASVTMAFTSWRLGWFEAVELLSGAAVPVMEVVPATIMAIMTRNETANIYQQCVRSQMLIDHARLTIVSECVW